MKFIAKIDMIVLLYVSFELMLGELDVEKYSGYD
jgi:hypothetical protein